MADPQPAPGKRQNKQRRQTAASETHGWEPRRAESRHSLPHPARHPDIQRPDRRRSTKYSSKDPRASADFLDTRSMPTPMRRQLLARPATPKARGRQAYDEDSDDEDDDDSQRGRLRGRMRSRSRVTWGVNSRATSRAKSKMKSRPTSQASESSDSATFATPTRSSYVNIRSVPSPPSLGQSSASSSGDSDDESSGSTEDYRAQTRALKERMNRTPDSERAPNPRSRSQSRPKSQERLVPEIESPAEDSEDQVISHHPRVVLKKSSQSRHRPAQQSRSRSRAPRTPRTPRAFDEQIEELTDPSPRRTQKKFYHSDFSLSEKPTLSRSRATSASRMTSRSVGSAKKQPLAKFFQQTFVSHPYDEDAQNHMCVQCTRKRSPKKLAKLKCGHQWCGFCLRRLFRDAIEDPQGMPPRCCTSDIIPLEYVHGQLDDEIIRAWTEKFAASSSKGRHYCPRSKCREMIQPGDYRYHKNGRTSATCRNCHTEICGECYKKWHDSKHCPTGADTAQFLKAGKDAGWQRCFQCKAMVELKEGCNHMTCRCGAQFCMNCGSKWKACECPFDLDEDELDAMQIPTPMVSRNRLGGPDLPRTLRPGLSYAHEPQRYRGHGDEHRPQQPHYLDDEDIEDEDEEDDDDDDDYMNDAGNMTGFGNPAGHFMGEDYGRRSHGPAVPAVPAVPSVPMTPPSVTLERPKAGGNYVSGVNKARGVRGPSMERLADRFSGQRQNFSPNSHGYGHAPPPTVPPLGMGLPPLHHQAPMVPNPISRRHTMDDDMFEVPFGPHYAPPSMPRRATAHTYMDDFAIPPPMGRHRNRHMGQMGQMGPMGPMGHTRGSELAGLTGPGSGMNRVFEWVNHVPYHSPDSQTIA